MTLQEESSKSKDFFNVTSACDDDKRETNMTEMMHTKVFSNKNLFQCYHNNRGYCSFRNKCRYQHYDQVCPSSVCRDQECRKRHPVICKFKEHCKFDKKSICSFKHVVIFENDSANSEIKALEVEIENLKHEVDALKKDVKLKETKLSEEAFQKVDMEKLPVEIRGKAETNLIEVVKELFEENKLLKDTVKNMEKTINDFTTKDPEEEIYPCMECDVEFYCDDALETHNELYHMKKNNICGNCDRDFECEDALETHRKQHHENTHECNICDYKTTTEKGLNIHKGSKHKEEKSTLKYSCGKCNLTFASRGILDKHVKTMHVSILTF